MNSFQTLIAFKASRNLLFHQVNIKSTSLKVPLTGAFFLAVLQRPNLDQQKSCLHLNKAIYGLKQAPSVWYDRLREWLVKAGFSPCLLNSCVIFRPSPVPICLYIHVNDIAIFRSDLTSLKEEIGKGFKIKDIGTSDLMLRVNISHSGEFISLDQKQFTESLLEIYGMEKCKSVVTPFPPQIHMTPSLEEDLEKLKELNISYQRTI
ncbi:hypothetical protein O181_027496 [Austropuccinia psidii MF-1]|uniref:Reverse transcriptase Ty1/copia-type domain-containing protein n=1 Tax=Austropuccinia psidii MF-1 TaxID=1389203 RepID=A0A9Q3H1H9_9BASI|nr:hypothetical protein [Austropuccinia psidii MF-1]